MFTGIVREMGKIMGVERIPGGVRLKIQAQESLSGMRVGDSIALNGACQTVVATDQISFCVEALEETLRRTTIGRWKTGDVVNLESPLGFNDLLGGHVVTGHVDGVGLIRARVRRAGDLLFHIQPPEELLAQIFERASVAIDGVSLTVVGAWGDRFSVALIPHTQKETTLGGLEIGDGVNLETDMIAKAVQRLLDPYLMNRGLTKERLEKLGF